MGSVEETAKNEAEIDALELEKILMNGHSNLISEQNIGQVEEGNSVKRVVYMLLAVSSGHPDAFLDQSGHLS